MPDDRPLLRLPRGSGQEEDRATVGRVTVAIRDAIPDLPDALGDRYPAGQRRSAERSPETCPPASPGGSLAATGAPPPRPLAGGGLACALVGASLLMTSRLLRRRGQL